MINTNSNLNEGAGEEAVQTRANSESLPGNATAQTSEKKQTHRGSLSLKHAAYTREQMTSPTKQVSVSLADVSSLQLSQVKDGTMTVNMKSPANFSRRGTVQNMNSQSKQQTPSREISSQRASLPPIMSTGQTTNVKVVIRVRPLNEREKQLGSQKTCIQVEDSTKIVLDRGLDQKNFTFDFVADIEIGQEEIFMRIAQPIADSCLQGYNGTIFAYGQTGSGKTFTIQGPSLASATGDEQLISTTNCSGVQLEARGLMQRSFEHIFACIDRERQEAEENNSEVKYLIKSSYLEIYNEQVMDLLDPAAVNLHVREDIKTGVYVEGLIEEPITSAKDMIALIQRGSRNRHVGSTSMNKESSRSHSVLTTQIESKTMTAGGVWQMKSSCFHIIDLAGSERSKHTNAEGQRLKEAGMINKSLSALGIVINSLVDISEGKTRHVHYRDSKLTFLLRDSLGGNSKTVIIANITSAQVSQGETLSTLAFAQRAKLIKNKAVINEESSGTIQTLKNEIRRMKQEMAEMQRLHLEAPKISLKEEVDSELCPMCKTIAENQDQLHSRDTSDEMLVDRIKSGGHSPDSQVPLLNMANRVVQLEHLLTANLDNLTSSHKYFEVESEKKAQSFKRMQIALEQLDKQSQRDKMIIKFRDQRIQKLEQTLAVSGQTQCNQCEMVTQQIQQVTKERDELRELYEKQTSTLAAKLFAEKEELKRQNKVLLNEIQQTPESLTAQLRGFNELTDSLSLYLKEHCEQKSSQTVLDLEAAKASLQEQLSKLQQDLESQVEEHCLAISVLTSNQKAEQSCHTQKLESLQQQSNLKQTQVQQEASEQISQIRRDLQALSENEAEFARQKLDSVQRQNDLSAKLHSQQLLLDESTQKDLTQQQKIQDLQVQNTNTLQLITTTKQTYDQELLSHQTQSQTDKDTLAFKLVQLKQSHHVELSQLQKVLLVEQSSGDTLREAESDLTSQVQVLETQNEDFQSKIMLATEQLQEMTREVTKLEMSLMQEQKVQEQMVLKNQEDRQDAEQVGKEALAQQYESGVEEQRGVVARMEESYELKIQQLTQSQSIKVADLELQYSEQVQQIEQQHKQQVEQITVLLTEQQQVALSHNSQELQAEHKLQITLLHVKESTLKQEIQSANHLQETTQATCSEVQKQAHSLALQVHQHEQTILEHQSNSQIAQKQQHSLEEQITSLLESTSSLKALCDTKSVECASLTVCVTDLQANNDQLFTQLSHNKCEINKQTDLTQQLQETHITLQSSLSSSQAEQYNLQQQLSLLQQQQSLLQQQLSSATQSLTTYQHQSQTSQAQQDNLSTQLAQQLLQTEILYAQLQEHKDTTSKQISEKDQRIELVLKQSNKQQSESDLQKQKLLNELKAGELENMQLQGQVMMLRSDNDLCKQNYTKKLQQIEHTVKSTLDLEKESQRQELDNLHQEQLVKQEMLLHEQFQQEMREVVQIQNEKHCQQVQQLVKVQDIKKGSLGRALQMQLWEVKECYDKLRVQQQAMQWTQLCSGHEQTLMAQMQAVVNELAKGQLKEIAQVKQSHSKQLQAQQALCCGLKQDLSDMTEQLKEYKNLTVQLQQEKSQQLKASNALCDQLKEAESQLVHYYEQQESSVGQVTQDLQSQIDLQSQVAKEQAMVLEATRAEMDTLRNQLIDVSTDLARQKSKCQDLAHCLKQSKDTISGLVEKENALMDELQGKMGELGISQDKWKQKCHEQKRELAECKAKLETLTQKYDLVCQSQQQLIQAQQQSQMTDLNEEIQQLRATARKRETEFKEVVITLKRYSDDKKVLEQELAMLQRHKDNSEGHNNLQQKIQHHLKIKEENNKLREENYLLKEEVRRKCEMIAKPGQTQSQQSTVAQDLNNHIVESTKKDCLMIVECFDQVLEQALQLPGSAQLLQYKPQLADVLRRASQGASSSQHAAQNCKQKALVIAEIIGNMTRIMQSLKVQQQQQQEQQVQPRGGSAIAVAQVYKQQPSQGSHVQQRVASAGLQRQQEQPPSATLNLNQMRQYPLQSDGKFSGRAPVTSQSFQTGQQQPGLQSQQEKENKVSSAAAFLSSVQQRGNSQRK